MIGGSAVVSLLPGEIAPIVSVGVLSWVAVDLVSILFDGFHDKEGRAIVGKAKRKALQAPKPSLPAATVEQRVLKRAEQRGGVLVPTDVAMNVGIGLDEAQGCMESMVRRGHMQMHVRQDGVAVYVVPDMLTDERRDEIYAV